MIHVKLSLSNQKSLRAPCLQALALALALVGLTLSRSLIPVLHNASAIFIILTILISSGQHLTLTAAKKAFANEETRQTARERGDGRVYV